MFCSVLPILVDGLMIWVLYSFFCLFPVCEAKFDIFLSMILSARAELDSSLHHLPWIEAAIALIYNPSLGLPPSKKRQAPSSSAPKSAESVGKKQTTGIDFL